MESSGEKKLKYLRQRMAILDRVIAGMEQLAAHPDPRLNQPYPNLAPPHLRLYRCDDRGSSNGRLRSARRATSLGTNRG
jgi:hypothetical protein